jgi:hypothetical protein
MIRVMADGERHYRLEGEAATHVGWIRGQTIGLRGLRSEDEVLAGVALTWAPLDVALGRHYFGRLRRAVALNALRFVHDGAYEWISDGTVPLARVRRPPANQHDGDFAIEYVLPSYASEGALIAIAQLLGGVMQEFLANRPATARQKADAALPTPTVV